MHWNEWSLEVNHRWKASAFLPVLRSTSVVPGSVLRGAHKRACFLFQPATAEGGRLNSFGAVGHHQDVIFILLTVLGPFVIKVSLGE